MSKLNIDQKTIEMLFSEKNADFLIPDYQRPYAWQEAECQRLWSDIFDFALPGNNPGNFNSNEEYFLGPIVTFKNEQRKSEVIDGQQRLTTIMLLLRAFYKRFGSMADENSVVTKKAIEKCIWKTDEFGHPDKEALKIDSEVATDQDKGEFLSVLRTGDAPECMKSNYAVNYRFFEKKIFDFLNNTPTYFPYLPNRILKNCILLPIEAESQDTALRIFSTLNDRGKPLSDADIFKAQFYKYYAGINKKDQFIEQWKALDELCDGIFNPIMGTPMDELFTRYMYYVRAKQGNRNTTTEALRKFYEKDSYSILKREETFDDLNTLAIFWRDVADQNNDRFSEDVLKRLFVLHYAPNGMWSYFVSVYFMYKKDESGQLDNASFCQFLHKITAFIWAYAFTNPGVNALRTPVYAEMVNLINGQDIDFGEYRFEAKRLQGIIANFKFTNIRPITKSMLAWWAFQQTQQNLLPLTTIFQIEHIFAVNRQEKEQSLQDSANLEALGNKSFLERCSNIRASDYRFEDKVKYYKGEIIGRGKPKEATELAELINLSNKQSDFTEKDIVSRDHSIIDGFIKYVEANGLLL